MTGRRLWRAAAAGRASTSRRPADRRSSLARREPIALARLHPTPRDPPGRLPPRMRGRRTGGPPSPREQHPRRGLRRPRREVAAAGAAPTCRLSSPGTPPPDDRSFPARPVSRCRGSRPRHRDAAGVDVGLDVSRIETNRAMSETDRRELPPFGEDKDSSGVLAEDLADLYGSQELPDHACLLTELAPPGAALPEVDVAGSPSNHRPVILRYSAP
jgi:hypothetical protein